MIQVSVNGVDHDMEVSADTPLLWVLRDTLGLTGTKYGCGIAQCGACTVHVDGKAVRSCVLPISQVANRKVTTIEGLDSKVAKTIQAAWEELNVVQCGYCQSGQIMSATALLSQNHNPSDENINTSMSGNICRCATYFRIRAAIKQAAKALA
jgi:isoquinoline 1-oxidoreductase alpha subunit